MRNICTYAQSTHKVRSPDAAISVLLHQEELSKIVTIDVDELDNELTCSLWLHNCYYVLHVVDSLDLLVLLVVLLVPSRYQNLMSIVRMLQILCQYY